MTADTITPYRSELPAGHDGFAQLLHADSLGMVAPGKVADLVVVNGNPAGNIGATRNIAMVMIRGRIIRPDSLRATWRGR